MTGYEATLLIALAFFMSIAIAGLTLLGRSGSRSRH